MPKPKYMTIQEPEPEPVEIVTKTRKPRKPKVNVDEPIINDVPEPVMKKDRKPNAWLEHCKQVRAVNQEMRYSDILKLAKESYKKD